MPTPSNRTPIRVARGTTSNLNSSISDIQEGEIVFSTDDNKLLVKEGSSLTDTQANVAAKANIASPTFTGTVTIPAGASIADIGSTIQAHDADTAKTDVAQTYTAGQRAEVTTLTSSSGSVAIDFSASNNFKLTLSEAVTAITVSNATAGQSGSIFIEQPSSGGPYAVGGWVAAFLFSGAAAPTITQTASKCDRVDYTILSATQIQVVWTGNY